MFALLREIMRWVACLCFVLVRLKVNDNCVWIGFVSFRGKFVVPPGSWFFMFPSFDEVVTQGSDFLTAGQSFYVRDFSCCFFAFFVSPKNFGSLFGIREALDTAVPVATMKLEDSFGFKDDSHQQENL